MQGLSIRQPALLDLCLHLPDIHIARLAASADRRNGLVQNLRQGLAELAYREPCDKQSDENRGKQERARS